MAPNASVNGSSSHRLTDRARRVLDSSRLEVRPGQRIHRVDVLAFGGRALGERDGSRDVPIAFGKEPGERSWLGLFPRPSFALDLLGFAVRSFRTVCVARPSQQVPAHRDALRSLRQLLDELQRIGILTACNRYSGASHERVRMRREKELRVLELALGVREAVLMEIEVAE